MTTFWFGVYKVNYSTMSMCIWVHADFRWWHVLRLNNRCGKKLQLVSATGVHHVSSQMQHAMSIHAFHSKQGRNTNIENKGRAFYCVDDLYNNGSSTLKLDVGWKDSNNLTVQTRNGKYNLFWFPFIKLKNKFVFYPLECAFGLKVCKNCSMTFSEFFEQINKRNKKPRIDTELESVEKVA